MKENIKLKVIGIQRRYCGKSTEVKLYHAIEEAEKAEREKISEIVDSILSPELRCIKKEEDPDNCSCVVCVRNTFRNDLKRRIKDD